MRYLFVFLLIGLVSCGDDATGDVKKVVTPKLNEYSEDEVTYPNGIVYLKKNMKPVTGIVRDNYESGQLKYEKHYEDGKLNGLARGWYESGQLEQECNLKGGKLYGLRREWYENGQLKVEANLEDGSILSKKTFDRNGNLIL